MWLSCCWKADGPLHSFLAEENFMSLPEWATVALLSKFFFSHKRRISLADLTQLLSLTKYLQNRSYITHFMPASFSSLSFFVSAGPYCPSAAHSPPPQPFFNAHFALRISHITPPRAADHCHIRRWRAHVQIFHTLTVPSLCAGFLPSWPEGFQSKMCQVFPASQTLELRQRLKFPPRAQLSEICFRILFAWMSVDRHKVVGSAAPGGWNGTRITQHSRRNNI